MKALVLAMLVALATPASAFTPAGQSLVAAMASQERADIVAASPAREAAARYFAADVAVTLGALVLACGAFAAAGYANKRRAAPVAPPKPAWEDAVMQALEAELVQFAYEYRRAA
jgi:uncharacterized membrane protein